MILVIDYGMGNMRSIEKALARIGTKFKVSGKVKDFEKATHIIIPGVGSFGEGIKSLGDIGLIDALKKEVLVNKKPLLGICLGMQLLFKDSEEGGLAKGLGLIEGSVKRFNFVGKAQLKIPHMGWNEVFGEGIQYMPLFKNIEQHSNFYFVHSFHVIPDEKAICGYTDYGYDFVSAVQKGNIFGVQFHPEKSQKKGLEILRNFAALPGGR